MDLRRGTLRGQSEVLAALEAGTLDMRTLEGTRHADLVWCRQGAAVRRDRARSRRRDAFIAWIESEAPKKTGPSGVGKENYTWYEQNVHLVPYDWDQQVTLLRRELERARASLALEEFRNRALPQLAPADTPEAWRALVEARMQKFTDFLIHVRDRAGPRLLPRRAGAAGPEVRAARRSATSSTR